MPTKKKKAEPQPEVAADRDVPSEDVTDPGLLSGEASKTHGPFGFLGPSG